MSASAAETAIGAVVLVVAAGFLVFAGRSGGLGPSPDSYELSADFRSVEGISVGTDVRLAGIKVGTVTGLTLDATTFNAEARFTVRNDLKLPDDSDVKIASEGLLGGSFLEITPGASDVVLAAGDRIENTQGAVSLLNLLMRFGTGQ